MKLKGGERGKKTKSQDLQNNNKLCVINSYIIDPHLADLVIQDNC